MLGKIKTILDKRPRLSDSIFIALVVLLSSALYLSKIGLYGDDWGVMASFKSTSSHTLINYIHAITTPNTVMRPVFNIYIAAIYYLFGQNFFSYQVLNAIVLAMVGVLFYLSLRLLKIGRLIALAVSVVYILLPNYSTDRFWYSAFQANLSMLFFFLSLLTGLHSFSQKRPISILWSFISVVSLLCSTLSYEVILPFFFIQCVLFAYYDAPFSISKISIPKIHLSRLPLIFISLASVFGVITFKVMTTTRLANGPLQQLIHYPGYLFYIFTSAIKANLILTPWYMVKVWVYIVFSHHSISTIVVSLLLGLLLFVYFSALKENLPTTLFSKYLIIAGLFLFGFGYSIFCFNNNVGFSPTGIDNRVAIVASIGVAIAFVGIIGYLLTLLPNNKSKKTIFSIAIAIVGMSGLLVINTLALDWAASYKAQTKILASIKQQFTMMPKGATLILDGTCPYIGPGIIFDSRWDLKGAIQSIYLDRTLKADIVTPRMSVTKAGLKTKIWDFETKYPYKDLYIFNYKTRKAVTINNEDEAKKYFRENNPSYNKSCHGIPGNGENPY